MTPLFGRTLYAWTGLQRCLRIQAFSPIYIHTNVCYIYVIAVCVCIESPCEMFFFCFSNKISFKSFYLRLHFTFSFAQFQCTASHVSSVVVARFRLLCCCCHFLVFNILATLLPIVNFLYFFKGYALLCFCVCFCFCLVTICWRLKCKTFVLSSMRCKVFLRTTLRMSNALMNFLFAVEVLSILSHSTCLLVFKHTYT